MPVYYKDVEQNTTAWRELRCGVPCASQMHRIITPKGALSKSAEMYLFELLSERITGEPAEGYQSFWMLRGSELESSALDYYRLLKDVDTESCGFITLDDGTAGCSPDQLVGETGLLEVKVPKPAIQCGYLFHSGAAYEEHRIQIQTQLFISEREYVDLLAFNPMMPPALQRIGRDEPFITQIRHATEGFSVRLGELTDQAIKSGWIQERKETMRDKTIVDILKEALVEVSRK